MNSYNFTFYSGQIDVILRALELYAFNMHHTWSLNINSNSTDHKNSLLFYTYHQILSANKEDYRVGYDIMKQECLNRKKIRKFTA